MLGSGSRAITLHYNNQIIHMQHPPQIPFIFYPPDLQLHHHDEHERVRELPCLNPMFTLNSSNIPGSTTLYIPSTNTTSASPNPIHLSIAITVSLGTSLSVNIPSVVPHEETTQPCVAHRPKTLTRDTMLFFVCFQHEAVGEHHWLRTTAVLLMPSDGECRNL